MHSFLRRAELLLHPRKLIVQLGLYTSFLVFFLRHRFLRSSFTADGQPVLFISLSNWVPRAILDGTLMRGLAAQGHRPILVTYRSATWARRYAWVFGIRDTVFFDDLILTEATTGDERLVDSLLASHRSFSSLLTLTVDGVPTGRHILSTLVNRLKCGDVDLDDPVTFRMLRDILRSSILASRASRVLFSRYPSPAAVLWMERGYSPYGEVFDEALRLGLNCIQYFHGHRSDGLIMRRYRQHGEGNRHPFSLSLRSWEKVQADPWSVRAEEEFMERMRSSYRRGSWFNQKFTTVNSREKTSGEVRSQLGLDPAKKIAVIFSHVLWDGTFFYGNNLFRDYQDWLVETVKVACKNPAVNWLIKLHPDYVWKVKQFGSVAGSREAVALAADVGVLPAHISIVPPDTDISTYSFFQCMDYCVTVRGTVGIEAPCFGVPVLTAGTGRYSGMGFTNDSQTREEYLEKIRTIQTIPRLDSKVVTLARQHAQALFERRLLPFKLCEIAPVDTSHRHVALFRVNKACDFEKDADLGVFVDWVLRSHDDDYLAAPVVH